MAVVDSRARVFGVKGVRVVDASAFPFLPPGHPQSTVCEFSPPSSNLTNKICGIEYVLTKWMIDALAEKIADYIKKGE